MVEDTVQIHNIQRQHKYSASSNLRQASHSHDHLHVSLLELLLKLDPN